jgi:hypothetical protein
MSFTDRDNSMPLFDLAKKTLGEVRPYVYDVSPTESDPTSVLKVMESFELVSARVDKAVDAVLAADRDIPRLLEEDDRLTPAARHESASKVLMDAQEKVDALKQAEVAALEATKLLEGEAMPTFAGDGDEQRDIKREIENQMSRSSDPIETLTRMAKDPRYAALVASPFGRVQLYERGLNDRQVEDAYRLIRIEALLWAAEKGTQAQRKAAERVELVGEKMQGAVLAAVTGAKGKLDPLSARVKRLGDWLLSEEARRVREAGHPRRSSLR